MKKFIPTLLAVQSSYFKSLNNGPLNCEVLCWCPYCKQDHSHGFVKSGRITHRAAHCTSKESPFHSTGYYLKFKANSKFKEICNGR